MVSLSLVTVFVTVTLSADVVLLELLAANKIIISKTTPPKTQAHGSIYHVFAVDVDEVEVVVVAMVLSCANAITELNIVTAKNKNLLLKVLNDCFILFF